MSLLFVNRRFGLFLLLFFVGASSPARAQHLAQTRVGVQVTGSRVPFSSVEGFRAAHVVPDTVRQGWQSFTLGGALVGAIAGGLLATSFRSGFCASGPGVTCSTTSAGEGALIGAAVGAVVGWIAWSITQPRAR